MKTKVIKEIKYKNKIIEIPLAHIEGNKEGPTLAVVAGVHGSEYVGIQTAIKLFNEINTNELFGKLIIIPIANIPGFLERSMHICPVDQKNLGSLFPGDLKGSYTQVLAASIFDILLDNNIDYLIDLHGGDLEEVLTPYSSWALTYNDKVDKISEELAKTFDMPFIMKKTREKDEKFETGGLYNAAAEKGIPAILAEAGSHGILDNELVEDFHYRGLNNIMKYLGMIEGKPSKKYKAIKLEKFVGVSATERGFFYPNIKAGQIISEGAKIGILKDFFGHKIEEYYSPVNACVLGVITTPSMKKGDMIAGLGKLEE